MCSAEARKKSGFGTPMCGIANILGWERANRWLLLNIPLGFVRARLAEAHEKQGPISAYAACKGRD